MVCRVSTLRMQTLVTELKMNITREQLEKMVRAQGSNARLSEHNKPWRKARRRREALCQRKSAASSNPVLRGR